MATGLTSLFFSLLPHLKDPLRLSPWRNHVCMFIWYLPWANPTSKRLGIFHLPRVLSKTTPIAVHSDGYAGCLLMDLSYPSSAWPTLAFKSPITVSRLCSGTPSSTDCKLHNYCLHVLWVESCCFGATFTRFPQSGFLLSRSNGTPLWWMSSALKEYNIVSHLAVLSLPKPAHLHSLMPSTWTL